MSADSSRLLLRALRFLPARRVCCPRLLPDFLIIRPCPLPVQALSRRGLRSQMVVRPCWAGWPGCCWNTRPACRSFDSAAQQPADELWGGITQGLGHSERKSGATILISTGLVAL